MGKRSPCSPTLRASGSTTPQKEEDKDAAWKATDASGWRMPPRFARWLFNGRPPSPKGARPEQKVDLPQPVPIYITYLTAVRAAPPSLISTISTARTGCRRGASRRFRLRRQRPLGRLLSRSAWPFFVNLRGEAGGGGIREPRRRAADALRRSSRRALADRWQPGLPHPGLKVYPAPPPRGASRSGIWRTASHHAPHRTEHRRIASRRL